MRKSIVFVALIVIIAAAACGVHTQDAAQTSALTSTNTTLPKAASVIPLAQRLAARDAGIALSGGGYTLSWKYENPGDYSQDGIVGLEDIAPLSEHFNETASAANEWIDGSGDGVIGVADITPIAMNWGSEVIGYRIDGADTTDGAWSEVASLMLDDGDDTNGRLAFSQEIAPGFTYYRVVTLTPDGDSAFSEPLVAPSNEPIIYGVTPTSGYQHEEYTFTATASGQEPLTYAWDFGGGTSPNASSDVSPTVTLSDAGEYSASLTISNSDSPTTFPFTLTVNARDTWAHTWGGDRSDEVDSMAIDADGNIYLVGRTSSFGVGYEDILVLKYSPGGDVLWVKTWGTEYSDIAAGCGLAGERLIIIGKAYLSEARRSEIIILKYDLEGNLFSQTAWGTEDYETVSDAAIDAQGSVFIIGTWYTYGSSTSDTLIAKLQPDGAGSWAKYLRFGSDHLEGGVSCSQSGDAFYCTAYRSDDEDYDSALLKYSESGIMKWAKSWDSGANDWAKDSVIDGAGRICLTGGTQGFGVANTGVLLMDWDAQGHMLSSQIWEGDYNSVGQHTHISADGDLYITGISYADIYTMMPLLLAVDTENNLVVSKIWNATSANLAALQWDFEKNQYLAGSVSPTDGEWVTVTGLFKDVSGTVDPLQVTELSLDASYSPVEGVETTPSGLYEPIEGHVHAWIQKNVLR